MQWLVELDLDDLVGSGVVGARLPPPGKLLSLSTTIVWSSRFSIQIHTTCSYATGGVPTPQGPTGTSDDVVEVGDGDDVAACAVIAGGATVVAVVDPVGVGSAPGPLLIEQPASANETMTTSSLAEGTGAHRRHVGGRGGVSAADRRNRSASSRDARAPRRAANPGQPSVFR